MRNSVFILVFLIFGCVGQKKAVESKVSKPPIQFVDSTGLKVFLDRDLTAPGSSLTASRCTNKRGWSCDTTLASGDQITLTADQSKEFVEKHLFYQKPELVDDIKMFTFTFLGCLDIRGQTRCRIEEMTDLTSK